MSRTEIADLVEEKFKRQEQPDAIGTLKRCDCEIGNILDCVDLHPDHRESLEDLHKQVKAAIG